MGMWMGSLSCCPALEQQHRLGVISPSGSSTWGSFRLTGFWWFIAFVGVLTSSHVSSDCFGRLVYTCSKGHPCQEWIVLGVGLFESPKHFGAWIWIWFVLFVCYT